MSEKKHITFEKFHYASNCMFVPETSLWVLKIHVTVITQKLSCMCSC